MKLPSIVEICSCVFAASSSVMSPLSSSSVITNAVSTMAGRLG